MTTILTRNTAFEKLLADAQKILAEGKAEAKRAVEPVKIRTYFKLGKCVNDALRIQGGRAEYGDSTVEELAPHLGMSDRTLWRIVHVQGVFKIPPKNKILAELKWSHLEILSGIEDKKEREKYLRLVLRHKWDVADLAAEIRGRRLLINVGADLRVRPTNKNQGEHTGSPLPKRTGPDLRARKFQPLVARKGEFFTYRLIKTRNLLRPSEEIPALDLGFHLKHFPSFASLKNPKPGDLVRVVRTKKNPQGDRYRLERFSPPGKKFYATYKAYVTRVIDDDTQWADMDLGFRNGTDPKLRLRGVNAAEIEKGKPASDFVKRTLARVPFVVIAVSGHDKYGRALVDLFYLPVREGDKPSPAYKKEKVLREGIFLNQQLLDLSLAMRM